MKEPFFSRIKIFWRGNFKSIIGVVVILVLAGGYYYVRWQEGTRPIFRIEPSSINLTQGTSLQLRAFYDADGSWGATPEKEVTYEADWSTDNQNIGYIANKGPIKGLLSAPKDGNLAIIAKYEGFNTSVKTNIAKAELVIECAPTFGTTGKVNKPIQYITFYKEIGLPDYSYIWTAPENQISKLIVPEFTFTTPGEKIVHVVVTDQANTTVEADCKPLTITK